MAVTRLTGGLTPADGGDPRTFPAIWNATADQIETAQTDIDALEADVFEAQGDISALQGSVAIAQGDITTLEGDLSTTQGNLATLQSDLSDLESVAVTLAAGTPVNGNTVIYSTASGGWIPGSGGGGGGGISESYPITTVFLLGM